MLLLRDLFSIFILEYFMSQARKTVIQAKDKLIHVPAPERLINGLDGLDVRLGAHEPLLSDA